MYPFITLLVPLWCLASTTYHLTSTALAFYQYLFDAFPVPLQRRSISLFPAEGFVLQVLILSKTSQKELQRVRMVHLETFVPHESRMVHMETFASQELNGSSRDICSTRVRMVHLETFAPHESEWFVSRHLFHTSQNGSSGDVCSTRECTKSQNSSKMPCNVLDVICKKRVQQHTHWHWSDTNSSEYSLTQVWHELIRILTDTGLTWAHQHTHWHWSDMNSSAYWLPLVRHEFVSIPDQTACCPLCLPASVVRCLIGGCVIIVCPARLVALLTTLLHFVVRT